MSACRAEWPDRPVTRMGRWSVECDYRAVVLGILPVMAYAPEDRPVSPSGADLAPPPADLAPANSPADVAPPPSADLLPPAPSADLLPPAPSAEQVVEPPARREHTRVPWTRTSAVWFGVWAGVAGLILLIIFVAQNTANVQINFLWLHGQIPLALSLLIAGVCGAAVAMAVGAVRIIQLRRLVHRGR